MSDQVKNIGVSRAEVLATTAKILEKFGTPKFYADSVAESLVQAQEAGHASHGIIRLIEYTNSIEKKVINPKAVPIITRETGGTVVIDRHWGWGQIACKFAVEVASAKAEEFGISAISISSCNHIGRLGEYIETLASMNLISMM